MVILLPALALAGCASGSDSGNAKLSFNPSATYDLSDPSAGASADIILAFDIPAPDASFKSIIFFTPPEWGIATDSDIPNGAIVGRLAADVTLGLLGQACSSSLSIEFTLLDATVDPGKTIPFGESSYDTPPGQKNQFDVGSDGLPLGTTLYPDYLTRIFPGQTPIARAYGQIAVAGIGVSINILTFEPGTAFGELVPDPSLGYPTIPVLDNMGDPGAITAPAAVTDFCTPFKAAPTLFGISEDNPVTSTNESGFVVRTNPSSNRSYNFVTFSRSQRDADDDGIENALDSCPFDPNVGSPRVTEDGDADSDGLDAACDPDDSDTNADQDMDGYLNRQDNCPLDPNGEAPDNQKDSDLDGIGDQCDPNPGNADGLYRTACLIAPVVIGGGVPPDPPPQLCRLLKGASP